MRASVCLLILALSCTLAAEGVVAQVKIRTGPDGRAVLYNDDVFNASRSSRTLIDPRRELLVLIERYAQAQRLDPLLVRAVIQVESGYDPFAVSRKGALGLMQLMPTTAAELRVADPFDAEANIRGGTAYMRLLLDEFDDRLVLALAGYNAGPEAVRRYGGIPPYRETRDYVQRVLRLYEGSEFVSIPESSLGRAGRRTYLVRKDGRLVMTTTPPSR